MRIYVLLVEVINWWRWSVDGLWWRLAKCGGGGDGVDKGWWLRWRDRVGGC